MANYTATTWVDDQPAGTGTPLNAANLNKLEGGAAAALPRTSVVAGGAMAYANYMVQGDTQAAFAWQGTGQIWWGPGGSAAVDTTLYRGAAATLATDSMFDIRSAGPYVFGIRIGTEAWYRFGAQHNSGNVRLEWGPGGATVPDTNLYRQAASTLRTDGEIWLGGAAQPRTKIRQFSEIQFGDGSAVPDTNLYRSAAGVLKTDSSFQAASNVTANAGAAYQMAFYNAGGQAAIGFGSAIDTTLYRNAAGSLWTQGQFHANHFRAYPGPDDAPTVDIYQAASFPPPQTSFLRLFCQSNAGKLWLVVQWPGGGRTTIAQEP